MDDDQRDIVAVVWKELGNRIEVTYAEGESDRVRAGPAVAADIARDAGLTVVPTRDGMARWEKDPDPPNTSGSPDQGGESAT
jgi:hypothetical protein